MRRNHGIDLGLGNLPTQFPTLAEKEAERAKNEALLAQLALIQAGWLVPGGDKRNPYQHRKRITTLSAKQGAWVYVIDAEFG